MKKNLKRHPIKNALKKHKRNLSFKRKKRAKRKIELLFKERLKPSIIDVGRRLNKYADLKAPPTLSLNLAPKQFLDFINRFEKIKSDIGNKSLFFDLSAVEKLDFSGISLLIALRYKLQLYNIDFNGVYPRKKELLKLLDEYQFLEQMGLRPSYENIHFSVGKKNDKITIKGDSKVIPDLGTEIAEYVSEKLFGEECHLNDGLQTMLLELMANTFRWSDQVSGHNLWLLTMAFNKEEKRIEFQFVDFGIGVFESLNKSKIYENWLGRAFKTFTTNSSVFEDMLNARSKIYKSSTGLYFRGKGIPSIKENYERKFYDDVNILTNNVFADLKQEKYINLAESFSGTLVNWTIDKNNQFYKNII